MDLNDNNIGEAKEDRISELPDSLLHQVLSFLDIKHVARTAILSKRWKYIWTSVPNLEFTRWRYYMYPRSLSEINKFMDFVDTTLQRYDPSSSIQKFYLDTGDGMISASRVHSWISSIANHNIKQVNLDMHHLDGPLFLPLSLFRCETLIELKLRASYKCTIHLPARFSFPKLESLTLDRIKFTDECSWNEQHFSNCPVLEKLMLYDCTWFGVRNFCISTPALKVLRIWNPEEDNGLEDCDLKIFAPSLVSLYFSCSVAKDYDLSNFVALDDAEIRFRWHQCLKGYGAAVNKLLGALSHVQNRLTIDVAPLKVLSDADDFINNLATFHNLNELDLLEGPATDELIFALLKAVPNLKRLKFGFRTLSTINGEQEYDDDEEEYDESTEGLCQRLQSVYFATFFGERKQWRWAEMILKNATSLQRMTIAFGKNKEVLKSELPSLPRASAGCVFEFLD